MSPRKNLHLGLVSLVWIFYINSCQAVKFESILTQSDFYQTLEPNGEYMFQFNGDEVLYVDLDQKIVKWRLPQFGEFASLETATALQNQVIHKYNLDIWEKSSNYTKAKSVVHGDIHVFPEKPVFLGEPASLICFVSQFFPPVIKMSWLKNNQPMTKGVSETDYYPAQDGSFSRFLYLADIPEEGDVYTCSVEHDGLAINPTNKFWYPDPPKHVSEVSENVVCGLGLAFGIAGIIAGITLICKRKKNPNQERQH